MNKIEFAALKYYNNVISDECLYVGMLFHNLSTGRVDFKHISNFKRFQAFDDEADVNFVKHYLAGIKHQVESNIFNYQNAFSISDYSRVYVNEFRFSNVITINVEDNEDYVTNFSKTYLKYDLAKNKRLSKDEERKNIKRILMASNLEFSEPKISGDYEENVTFDYIVGNYAIKMFSFKGKNASKLVPAAKQWSFSADELRNRYKVVFLYDEDDVPSINMVLGILRKNAKVFRVQEGLEYILKSTSERQLA